jgi:hypothetical protein
MMMVLHWNHLPLDVVNHSLLKDKKLRFAAYLSSLMFVDPCITV